MNDRSLNDMLKNPLCNGWVARKGERSPAPWRDEGRPEESDARPFDSEVSEAHGSRVSDARRIILPP